MKVLNAKVDWNLRWANSPSLYLLVDKIPDDLEYEQRGDLYFAEKEGFVNFFYYNRPDQGYGGRKFHLKMKDGSEKVLIGPWSSNSSAMNAGGFPLCMECTITDNLKVWEKGYTFYAGAVLVEVAEKALEKFVPEAMILRPKEFKSYETASAEQNICIGNSSFFTIVLKSGFYKPGIDKRWKEEV
jgi:hypothetical protein